MLSDYRKASFAHEGCAKPVYVRGEGPAVILLHELPGITPQVLRFADWLAEAGFRVYLPELVGVAGKEFAMGYYYRSLARVCVSREFAVLASNRSSPVTNWLRALARQANGETGGRGVGAVGMCISGNFALSMMLEPCLKAAVTAQPSLPLPFGEARRAALHLSPAELQSLKKRGARGERFLGLRFAHDPYCPRQRFDTLRRELGDAFAEIELPESSANPASPTPVPHSVLTNHLVDRAGEPTKAAAERVIAFLKERLSDGAPRGAA